MGLFLYLFSLCLERIPEPHANVPCEACRTRPKGVKPMTSKIDKLGSDRTDDAELDKVERCLVACAPFMDLTNDELENRILANLESACRKAS